MGNDVKSDVQAGDPSRGENQDILGEDLTGAVLVSQTTQEKIKPR